LFAIIKKILKSYFRLNLLQIGNLNTLICYLQNIVVFCCSIIARQKEKTIYRQKDKNKVEKTK